MRTALLFFTLLFVCMLFSPRQSYGQNYDSYIYTPSPQTWDFMAYGNVPVSTYTGRLDMQIPIYHYKDKDFDIPVSIAYNSAGFVPSKPAGPLGLNWFLNCGGVITRKIVGIPDDKVASNGAELQGFFKGIKSNSVSGSLNSMLFNYNTGRSLGAWRLGSSQSPEKEYETTPDIFSFNFMGYSGKFAMGHDGKIHVWDCVGYGAIKVDVRNVGEQTSLDNQQKPIGSEIIITTGDGYIYTFGGSVQNLEYFYAGGTENYHSSNSHPFVLFPATIAAWYLSKITAPNGRTVTFKYDESDKDKDITYINPTKVTQYPDQLNPNAGDCYVATLVPRSERDFEKITGGWSLQAQPPGYSTDAPHYQLMRTAFLKEIYISGAETIEFKYTKKSEKDSYDINDRFFIPLTLKLDTIRVQDNFSRVIKEALFTTSYQGAQDKSRLFLDMVTLTGEGNYSFEYNNTSTLPSSITRTVDYWGFWKGGDDSSFDMFGGIALDNNGNITYTNGNREPVSSFADASLLNKVTYPTGGYTEIEYESHTYSSRLERRSANGFMPMLYDVTGTAGGARVKKIKDYDGTVVSRERTFEYTKSGSTGVSSGIVMSWIWMVLYNNNILQQTIRSSSSGFSINCTDAEYIAYPRVIERFSGGGYIVHEHSSYSGNTIDDTAQIRHSIINLPDNSFDPLIFWQNFHRQPNDRSIERGKRLSSKLYNSSNVLVSKDTVIYGRAYNGEFFASNEPYITSISLSGNQYYSYKNYIYSYLPRETRTITYDERGNNPFTKISTIEYGYTGLESKRTEPQSDGSIKEIETTYLGDIVSGINSFKPGDTDYRAWIRLQELNMLGYPIEQVEWLKRNGVIVYSSAVYTSYDLFNDVPRPSVQYRFSLSSPSNLYEKATLLIHHPYNFASVSKDERLEEEARFLYDNKGNLIQYTNRSGFPVSYLWGYRQLYPIAKIVGSSYDIVYAALDNSQKWLLSANTASMISNIKPLTDSLRKKLPTALISGYSYIPSAGLSAEVSPNGLITYYKYDNYGRLSRIVDHNGKAIEHYQYHYAGQSNQTIDELWENAYLSSPSTNPPSTYVPPPPPPPPPPTANPTVYISVSGEYIGTNCRITLHANMAVASDVVVTMQGSEGWGFSLIIPSGSSSSNTQTFYSPGSDIEVVKFSPQSDDSYNYYVTVDIH